MFHHGLLEGHGDEGAAVDTIAQIPGFFALGSEPLGKCMYAQGGDVSHAA